MPNFRNFLLIGLLTIFALLSAQAQETVRTPFAQYELGRVFNDEDFGNVTVSVTTATALERIIGTKDFVNNKVTFFPIIAPDFVDYTIDVDSKITRINYELLERKYVIPLIIECFLEFTKQDAQKLQDYCIELALKKGCNIEFK
jgi:hypothetical protein